MKNVIGNSQVAASAPTLHVGTYRRALLAAIIGNDLFTQAEQLRANHAAHECTCPVRLVLWTRNSLRVAKEREAAQQAKADFQAEMAREQAQPFAPQGNLLADLANPAFVDRHSAKQVAPGFALTVAEAAESLKELRKSLAQQPTAPAATAEQCSEIHKLAGHPALTAAERSDALFRLPTLTHAEATAFIGWLKLRTAYGPGVMRRAPLQPVALAVPAAQYVAASTRYGRLLPFTVSNN